MEPCAEHKVRSVSTIRSHYEVIIGARAYNIGWRTVGNVTSPIS